MTSVTSTRLSSRILLEKGFYQIPGKPKEYHLDLEMLQHKCTTLVLTEKTEIIHGIRWPMFSGRRMVERTNKPDEVTDLEGKIVTVQQLEELVHYFHSLLGF